MLLRRGAGRIGPVVVLGVVLLLSTGCAAPPGYVFSAICGQLAFLSAAEPIERALEDPTLTDEEREKLIFVVDARNYAEDVIGLRVGRSYRTFVNLRGEPLAWNLSASRKDAFTPHIWSFPLIGAFPYLGFFDLDQATAERDRLRDQGYDTMLYELDTYAIPILPNPITSSMLKRGYVSLADTVIHELLHNTILRPNDTDFNETLATWFGRVGALQFLEAHFGADAPIVDEAYRSYEDQDRFNAFITGLIAELREVYESDMSSADRIAARDPIFDAARRRFGDEVLPLMNEPARYEVYTEFPLNNAFLLANTRYHDHFDVYQGVFDANGGSWAATLVVFADASRASNPQRFLNDWLTEAAAAP